MYSSWVDPQYLTMDITQIYAIVIAGVALVFLLRTGVSCLAPNLIATSSHVYQYLSHSYVLNRHTLIGPWTGAGVLLHLIYLAVNAVCLSVGVTNLSHAGRRAGTLAVINLGLLLSGLHLNFLADRQPALAVDDLDRPLPHEVGDPLCQLAGDIATAGDELLPVEFYLSG